MMRFGLIAGLYVLLAASGVAQAAKPERQRKASAADLGGVSPMDYGCAGDGLTDDTLCFGKALAASYGRSLMLGPHAYLIRPPSVGYSPARPVQIVGLGASYAGEPASSIIVATANATLFTLHSNSSIRGVFIDMTNGGKLANTSGAAITMAASVSGVALDHLWIHGACNGVALNGSINWLQYSRIDGFTGGGCVGVSIGLATTMGLSVDDHILKNEIDGAGSSGPCLEILDAGGLFLTQNSMQFCPTGTLVEPGVNQHVEWLTSSGNYLGDTVVNQALAINTKDPSSVVRGVQSDEDWSASNSAQAPLVVIENMGRGTVAGIKFSSFRAMGANGDAIDVNFGVTDFQLNSSTICGFNGYGVNFAKGVSSAQIIGGKTSLTCDDVAGFISGTYGVNLAGSNSAITIANTDLTGVPTPIAGTPTGNSVVVNNLGVDGGQPNVSSASTINLNAVFPTWTISGAATVSTINGFWNG